MTQTFGLICFGEVWMFFRYIDQNWAIGITLFFRGVYSNRSVFGQLWFLVGLSGVQHLSLA